MRKKPLRAASPPFVVVAAAALLGAWTACSPELLPSAAGFGGAGGAGGGCVSAAAPCAVRFTYPLNGETSVEVRGDFAPGAWDVGVPMSLDGEQWVASVDVANGQTIQYKFFVDGTTWVNDPNDADTVSDNQGGLNDVVVASCGATCLGGVGGAGGMTGAGGSVGVGGGADYPNAFDWRSAFLYFVFVDRFKNGDPSNDAPIAGIETPANYQGGDYQGVIDEIDAGYFDDLGVNALWITVPMDNTNDEGIGSDGHEYSAYHGYWPQNLYQVEEHFGDQATLQELVDHAHQHDIKVLFDYVMNHVHISSSLWTEHQDWFWPLEYNGKTCVCGDGCDWNDPYEQKRCWFTSYLPDWNFTVDDARTYSVDNAVSWATTYGIDGFRLDAVKHIDPSWLFAIRARVTTDVEPMNHQHFYMVGETFESVDRDLIKSFIDPTTELDGQFDFPLRGAAVYNILSRQGTMYDLDGFLSTNDTYYDPGIMSTFLGNQDLVRTIQTALDQPWDAWSDGGDAKWDDPPGAPPNRAPYERMAVGFTFLLTTKGVPLLYYGDEIGMPGAGDPDNRRFMQFSGLSDDQTFLKATIQKLGAARKAHTALWRGTRTTASVTNDTYGYVMTDGADVVYVALNRGDLDGTVAGMPAAATDLLTGADVTGPTVTLPPRTSMVLVAR
jgi:glycosidase